MLHHRNKGEVSYALPLSLPLSLILLSILIIGAIKESRHAAFGTAESQYPQKQICSKT
jgi:uncharacterized protein (UPF0333 family)